MAGGNLDSYLYSNDLSSAASSVSGAVGSAFNALDVFGNQPARDRAKLELERKGSIDDAFQTQVDATLARDEVSNIENAHAGAKDTPGAVPGVDLFGNISTPKDGEGSVLRDTSNALIAKANSSRSTDAAVRSGVDAKLARWNSSRVSSMQSEAKARALSEIGQGRLKDQHVQQFNNLELNTASNKILADIKSAKTKREKMNLAADLDTIDKESAYRNAKFNRLKGKEDFLKTLTPEEQETYRINAHTDNMRAKIKAAETEADKDTLTSDLVTARLKSANNLEYEKNREVVLKNKADKNKLDEIAVSKGYDDEKHYKEQRIMKHVLDDTFVGDPENLSGITKKFYDDIIQGGDNKNITKYDIAFAEKFNSAMRTIRLPNVIRNKTVQDELSAITEDYEGASKTSADGKTVITTKGHGDVEEFARDLIQISHIIDSKITANNKEKAKQANKLNIALNKTNPVPKYTDPDRKDIIKSLGTDGYLDAYDKQIQTYGNKYLGKVEPERLRATFELYGTLTDPKMFPGTTEEYEELREEFTGNDGILSVNSEAYTRVMSAYNKKTGFGYRPVEIAAVREMLDNRNLGESVNNFKNITAQRRALEKLVGNKVLTRNAARIYRDKKLQKLLSADAYDPKVSAKGTDADTFVNIKTPSGIGLDVRVVQNAGFDAYRSPPTASFKSSDGESYTAEQLSTNNYDKLVELFGDKDIGVKSSHDWKSDYQSLKYNFKRAKRYLKGTKNGSASMSIIEHLIKRLPDDIHNDVGGSFFGNINGVHAQYLYAVRNMIESIIVSSVYGGKAEPTELARYGAYWSGDNSDPGIKMSDAYVKKVMINRWVNLRGDEETGATLENATDVSEKLLRSAMKYRDPEKFTYHRIDDMIATSKNEETVASKEYKERVRLANEKAKKDFDENNKRSANLLTKIGI